MKTIIYTDGSCLRPNGSGGCAFVIITNNKEIHYSEGLKSCTNNQAEMKAVIEALKFVEDNKEGFKIYSDSKLVINCATGIWKRNKNLDLWDEYDFVSKNKKIEFEWVKGHSGDKYNTIVDAMALAESREMDKLNK